MICQTMNKRNGLSLRLCPTESDSGLLSKSLKESTDNVNNENNYF